MKTGDIFTQTITIQDKDSARNLGSGGLNVFGTPAMIAYMENTALQMVKPSLPQGSDTVGIEINVKHLKASPIGAEIIFSSEITNIDGRKISFKIKATDSDGNRIGTATHDRFIVDVEKFMSKIN
jgi:predicted thioesterase